MSEAVYAFYFFIILGPVPYNAFSLHVDRQFSGKLENSLSSKAAYVVWFCNYEKNINVVGGSAGKMLHSCFVINNHEIIL